VVDLRAGSPTYGRWAGARLDPGSGLMLYAPRGCAHGYLTLEDDTELSYTTNARYAPEHARGVCHDDPRFAIAWPAPVRVISDADAKWPAHRAEDAIMLPP
jgi:dTDP-4-dehydrorhamnose 3,5-epimerase